MSFLTLIIPQKIASQSEIKPKTKSERHSNRLPPGYYAHYTPFRYGLYLPARVERVLIKKPAAMKKELYQQIVALLNPADNPDPHFKWNDARVILHNGSDVTLMIDGYRNFLQVDSWKQGRLTKANFAKLEKLLDAWYNDLLKSYKMP